MDWPLIALLTAAMVVGSSGSMTTGVTPIKTPDPIVIYSAVMEGHLMGVLIAQKSLRGDVSCRVQTPDGIDPLTADEAVRAMIDPDRYCIAWTRLQILLGR